MVDIAEGSTIIGCRITATESKVMILDIACSGDSLMEIGIISLVAIFQAILLRSSDIFSGIQHLHALTHCLDAIVALVRDLESLTCSLLGLHLDNTRSSTRTIHCRFAGILQDSKALDVGWIDGGKRRHIRSYTINDDQRVIASHDGSSTTHTN